MGFDLDDVEILRIPTGDGKFVVLCMLKTEEKENPMTEEEIFEYLKNRRNW